METICCVSHSLMTADIRSAVMKEMSLFEEAHFYPKLYKN
jgi:hypothetical protein